MGIKRRLKRLEQGDWLPEEGEERYLRAMLEAVGYLSDEDLELVSEAFTRSGVDEISAWTDEEMDAFLRLDEKAKELPS